MLSVKLFPGREAGWYNQFGDVQPGEGVPAGEKQWIPHLHSRGGGPVSCTHRQHQTGLDPGHPGLDQETRGTSTTGMRIDAHQCIFNVHACMLAGAFFQKIHNLMGSSNYYIHALLTVKMSAYCIPVFEKSICQ